MKLIRFGEEGKEKPGVQLEDGTRLDVSGFGQDYNEIFFGSTGIIDLKEWLVSNSESCPVIPIEIRLGAPLCRPSKIICIGLNYAKHAAESGMQIPKEPVFSLKPPRRLLGQTMMLLSLKAVQKPIGKLNWLSLLVKKPLMCLRRTQ